MKIILIMRFTMHYLKKPFFIEVNLFHTAKKYLNNNNKKSFRLYVHLYKKILLTNIFKISS